MTQAIENKGVKNNNLKKNLGGRPTRFETLLRDRVVNKSWDILERFFASPKIGLKQKAEIASKIAIRSMPTELEGNLSFTIKDLIADVTKRQGSNRVTELTSN